MKLSRFSLVNLAALLGLAFTVLPSHAQDLGDTVSQPGVFSYQAPKGWTVKDTSFSKYKIALDAPKNKFSANINVVVESYSGTLAKYVDLNKTNLKASPMFQNLQIVEEKPFTATAGATGVRLVITDTVSNTDLQQVFYFLEGAADTKFVVTTTSLVGDGDHYAPLFDASMKTFSPK
jgi:hypothetical protein